MDYRTKYLKYKNKYLQLKNTRKIILRGGVILPKPIPSIGLGTWFSKTVDHILDAIISGYRCIDCANNYRNEEIIGEAIKLAISEGIVTREELFIIGKATTLSGFEQSLRLLQIDKFDLALYHTYSNPENWNLMLELKKLGLADNIGLSNIYINKLKYLINKCEIEGKEIPVAIEDEVNFFSSEIELLNYCVEHDIKIIAYTPFGQKEGLDILSDNEYLQSLTQKYSITLPQLLLLWNIRRGITVIPASTNVERLIENLKTNDFVLDTEILNEEEIKIITEMGPGYPFIETAQQAKEGDYI